MTNLRSDDLKLEAVVIPVSDVDRAKAFYGKLGWRLDADFAFDDGFRVVQFTPPGSGCSVQRQEQEQIRGSVRFAQDDSKKQTTTVGSTLGFNSMHGDLAVEVDDEGVAGDLHGVDLQLVKLDVVAGAVLGFGEDLAEHVAYVDRQLLRELAA